jgi:hypothetical protein
LPLAVAVAPLVADDLGWWKREYVVGVARATRIGESPISEQGGDLASR